MVKSRIPLNFSYVVVTGSSKQLRFLFAIGYFICRKLTVGSGSKPMGGMQRIPVANFKISSSVTADSPPRPR